MKSSLVLPPVRTSSVILAVLAAVGVATSLARAQDSVALTPGGNDAISATDASYSRTRFAVDLVQATTSWNNPILIAPLLKSARDINPTFRTQILGAVAISPNLATGTTFSTRSFAQWAAPGIGVGPENTLSGTQVPLTGFASQFGAVISDFSLNPTSVTGATVGRVSGQFNRLFVERVVAASSRATAGGADTATLSVGGVDPFGNVVVRADNFNTLVGTTNRVLNDSLVRIDVSARTPSVNTLQSSGGTNTATDAAATTFVINNEPTPTNTATILNQPGVGPMVLAYDFAGRFRDGQSVAGLSTTGGHIPAGVLGHRGNPAFSTTTAAGGNAGGIASIAMPTSGARANVLMSFGLNFGSGGSAPTPNVPRAFTLPSPVSIPGFTANVSNTSSFKQYLSQTPFRGGNGQVGIGQDASGALILAAVANDPTPGVGDFLAVVRAPSGGGTPTWTIAGFPGMNVLSSQGGPSIGTLATPSTTFSAPGVDRYGNVYFIASWKPSLTPQETGVFKAVNTPSGYQLELLLRSGQQVTGVNSTRTYTITSLALADSDSIASGSMFSQSVIQQQDPAATANQATSIRAFGGLVVSAFISYDNAGTPETYDALLYVGPTQGVACIADFNGMSGVGVQDIFDFLAAWFAGSPQADVNNMNGVTVQDIFDFLAAWFMGC